MSLLNVGARALLANQVALQTAGNNIANVNTAGYSRQTVALETVPGQFTGGGYIGQGVDVQTILRNQSELLTRQSAGATAVQSADVVRAERLRQMQEVFSGGTGGLGAAINDMMNAFSDVVSAPTDITARTVLLTRMEETASRMRAASDRLNEIQYTVTEQLQSSITAVNSLAQRMATINDEIARVKGNGQTPNDLLDQRDQIIREINEYVQTTQIAADDGTIGLFIGGSQPLVLGSTATELSIEEASTFPGSGQTKLYFNRPGAVGIELDENVLGGGSISGLLRFQNSDLAEGQNLLGRLAMGIGTTLNTQHKLGLTLDGTLGTDLFRLPASMPGFTRGTAAGDVTFTDPTRFSASDYEIRFNGTGGGTVIRLADGKTTAFTDPTDLDNQRIDGLRFTLTAGGATGERMLFRPFSAASAEIRALVNSPRDLAAASPVNVAMGTNNGGTLQLGSLQTLQGLPAPLPQVTITFLSTTTYERSDNPGVPYTYTSGEPIYLSPQDASTVDPVTNPATGWALVLNGTPKVGDTVTLDDPLAVDGLGNRVYGDYFTRNAGNASSMLGLRDVKTFDESTLSDGFASAMAQVGTRTQAANFAADLSTNIAANLERDRTAVSGVNLDEEAAKLIQYQQAYQASAKMLQIAQNIFDTLIQGLRS